MTEVVGNLELREREAGLSAGEKRMLQKARHLRQLLSDGKRKTDTARGAMGEIKRVPVACPIQMVGDSEMVGDSASWEPRWEPQG